MRMLIHMLAAPALAGFIAPLAVTVAPPATAADGAFTPLSSFARRCDFSLLNVTPRPAFPGSGGAVISSDGTTVTADITFRGAPGALLQARLVQAPRSSASPCAGAEPGVVAGGLQLDGVGAGTLTLRDRIEPGSTGAWVNLFVPSPETQQPTQPYTSDFIAPV